MNINTKQLICTALERGGVPMRCLRGLTNVASRQQAGGMTLPLPPEQPAPGPTSTPVPNPSSPPDQTDDSCPTYRADCSPENLFSDTHVLPQAKALGMPGNQAQVGSGKRGRETPRN